LSISRELARMLGGEICLASLPTRGSTFTLYLPQSYAPALANPGPSVRPKEHSQPSSRQLVLSHSGVEDDRTGIGPNDQVAMIIEDDIAFARILLDTARSNGFKGIVALDGEEGLNAVAQWRPSAIVLDLHLPGTDGWSILDHLKHNPLTRHIPVEIISVDDERAHCLRMGAFGYVRKPANYEQIDQAFSKLKAFTQKKERSLLVVADDLNRHKSIAELVGNADVRPIAVATGREALEVLRSTYVDCMVMNIGLPDMTGFELIERIRKEQKLHDLRIVLYTERELSQREEVDLRNAAETMIVKEVRSLDRLMDEASLFLHRVECNLPPDKREKLTSVHRSDPALEGKKVLIIDDDVRNIFALTSLFEHCKMRVFFAETGADGIELLSRTPDIDAVIVDVMLPGMDGHETMRAIRANPGFASLPIFALTAKAMKGDREACLEAGATDYIAKPADPDHLISLLRAHVSRQSRQEG
jgi:CheY-like chemotaxis protein